MRRHLAIALAIAGVTLLAGTAAGGEPRHVDYEGFQAVTIVGKPAQGKVVRVKYQSVGGNKAAGVVGPRYRQCGGMTQFFMHVDGGTTAVSVFYDKTQVDQVLALKDGDTMDCEVCLVSAMPSCKLLPAETPAPQ